jgi:hypothetical protein
MVKLLFLCRRRPDITHERYAELLLEGHVPLALRHHPTMRRYVVNIVEEALAGAPPLDSVGALWFDTLADFRERLYDSAEGERVIARDVARFMGGADAYATREYMVRAPAPSAAPARKLVVCLPLPPDADRSFVREWFERRASAVLARSEVQGYVASVVEERLGADARAWGGFAEVHLDTPDPARAAEVVHLHGAGAAAYRVAEYVER